MKIKKKLAKRLLEKFGSKDAIIKHLEKALAEDETKKYINVLRQIYYRGRTHDTEFTSKEFVEHVLHNTPYIELRKKGDTPIVHFADALNDIVVNTIHAGRLGRSVRVTYLPTGESVDYPSINKARAEAFDVKFLTMDRFKRMLAGNDGTYFVEYLQE